jgi:hypothetical protein
LYGEQLRQLVFSLVCQVPGQEWTQVWRGLAAMRGTGLEKRL